MSPIAREPLRHDCEIAARARRFGALPYRELGWRPAPHLEMASAQVGRLLVPHVDRWWKAMGTPDPYVVIVEGPEGAEVMRGMLQAVPDCAPALRVVLVQPDEVARARIANVLQLEPAELALGPLGPGEDPDDEAEVVPGRGPIVAALATAPEVDGPSVLLAVGLLSRLPADVIEWREQRWFEVRLGAEADDQLIDVLVAPPPGAPIPPRTGLLAEPTPPPDLETGWRAPVTESAADWLVEARSRAEGGVVVVVDLMAAHTIELAGPTPRPGVPLDQIDPKGSGRRVDDEALSPLSLVEWGGPPSGRGAQRWR